ncbi:hypothetical protein A9P82_15140 [Arachidicoccus ginsenosidimutans]|nr:hypothetical protein A9P82_15140 [Arachidicoccus sp. BS20]
MKKIFTILLLTFSISNLLAQNNLATMKANDKSFPTNIFKGNNNELKKFDSKVIAYDGIIENS